MLDLAVMEITEIFSVDRLLFLRIQRIISESHDSIILEIGTKDSCFLHEDL